MNRQCPLLGDSGNEAAFTQPEALVEIDRVMQNGAKGRTGDDAGNDQVGRVQGRRPRTGGVIGEVVQAHDVLRCFGFVDYGIGPDAMQVESPGIGDAGLFSVRRVDASIGERDLAILDFWCEWLAGNAEALSGIVGWRDDDGWLHPAADNPALL